MGVFVQDSFTDSLFTNLQDHTPDIGNRWLCLAAICDSFNSLLIASNQLLGIGAGAANYLCPTTSLGPQYIVSARIIPGSDNGWTLRARGTIDSQNWYECLYSSADLTWRLRKKVNGITSELDSLVEDFGSSPTTVSFEIRDDVKRVLKDGVEKLSSSDNEIADAGFPGLTLDSADQFLDNFLAVSIDQQSIPVQLENHLIRTPARIVSY